MHKLSILCIILFLCIVIVPVGVYAQSELQPLVESRVFSDPNQSSSVTFATEEDDAGNVTLDFKEADILLVLRFLSLKSGVNIVAGAEVTGNVTIRLNNVPWEKALDVIVRAYGYVYERNGSIVRVTSRDNLAAEELVTETFVLNYMSANDVSDSIQAVISDRGRVNTFAAANTLIVTDMATTIYKVGEIIRRLDQRTPQVYIDSKIVITEEGNVENLGIRWNMNSTLNGSTRQTSFPFKSRNVNGAQGWYQEYFPTDIQSEGSVFATSDENGVTGWGSGSASLGIQTMGTLDFSQFTATLNYLKTFDSTKIISNPRITTMSSQEASIQVGAEVYIPQYERAEDSNLFMVSGYDIRETGVIMNVLAHVNDAREILVELKPELVTQGEWEVIGGAEGLAVPSFDTTKAHTTLLIQDGETVAIGGLKQKNETISESKVPGLGDIPFFGKAFRSSNPIESETETLFFVTITIVDTGGAREYE